MVSIIAISFGLFVFYGISTLGVYLMVNSVTHTLTHTHERIYIYIYIYIYILRSVYLGSKLLFR